MEIAHYIVASLLAISSIAGLLGSFVSFFKQHDNWKATLTYCFLLLTFALGCADVFLLRTNIVGRFIHVYHLPLWYTLSFGPLLFYYVKFSLFPNYIFRGSDFKHLILPSLQVFSVLYFTFQVTLTDDVLWDNFIRPIYGPIEYSLFLIFLFIYTSLSYRYIRYKIALLRRRGTKEEINLANQLRRTVKYFAVLATIYSFFALTDFIAYQFFFINLYEVKGFSFFGDLAFSGMLFWLVWRIPR